MKYLLRILLTTIFFFALLFLLIIIQSVNPVQQDPKSQTFVFPDTLAQRSYSQDSLKVLVGDNKGLPKGFEEAALLAYAAYPQLKDVRINMILTQSGAPMESNFDLTTLFGPKANRTYEILLNDTENAPFDEILLRNLPFDAQVGILAHELGHIAYYHNLSTLQIAKWGLKYLVDDDFRAKHERSTDLMPVYHGLGSQIHQYAYYVRHDSCCRNIYKKWGALFMDKYYLTDQEIKVAIETHALYKNAKPSSK